ncbi:hypothetical protein WME95_36690 [Sorangium sp. So ce327]|uniref:hypothetical protein n=1 Tax=Sorangium sp. So ce327 TaxID=3133301 RepID=UPI003F5EDDB1
MKRKTPLVLVSLFTLLGAQSVTMLNECTPTPAEDDRLRSGRRTRPARRRS